MNALLALGLVTSTPTPESAHFPEDPVLILRDGWPFLVAYYIVAALIVLFLWKALKVSRFLHSAKGRLITAAVLAGIFTPSEVSDFFLFNLPGPAAAGAFMLIIAVAMIAASDPLALLKPAVWSVVAGYYLFPLLIGFAIAYASVWIYSRRSHLVSKNP